MKLDPQTINFEFDDRDGVVLKRFSRTTPVEAWLMLVGFEPGAVTDPTSSDYDPEAMKFVTVPISINPALVSSGEALSISSILRLVARAANAALDLALERDPQAKYVEAGAGITPITEPPAESELVPKPKPPNT